MKLIIDIDESDYDYIKRGYVSSAFNIFMESVIKNGTPIPDNATSGKEVLIKYCLEHSGEEIYGLLKQIFDASMSWTDSRCFIIEWLEKGIRRDKE